MSLTNYWWLLIWMFLGGSVLYYFVPKQKIVILGKEQIRWSRLAAIVLIIPYIVWAGFRTNNYGDSLLSS